MNEAGDCLQEVVKFGVRPPIVPFVSGKRLEGRNEAGREVSSRGQLLVRVLL